MIGRGVLSRLHTLTQEEGPTLTLYVDIDQNKQANRRRGFMAGSGRPDFAATVSSRINRPKILARFASWAPLRCMMFLNWECPAISRFALRRLPRKIGKVVPQGDGRANP